MLDYKVDPRLSELWPRAIGGARRQDSRDLGTISVLCVELNTVGGLVGRILINGNDPTL